MPQAGLSGSEATIQNIEFCFQSDFSSFADLILMPIQFILFMIITIIDGILTLALSVMDFLGELEKDLGIIFSELYQMLLLFVIPFITMWLHACAIQWEN